MVTEPEPLDDASDWKPWWVVVVAAGGLLASFVIGEIILVAAYGGHFTTAEANNPTPAVTDLSTALTDIAFILVALIVAFWAGRPWPAQFGLRRPTVTLPRVAAIVVAGYVLFLMFSLLWQLVVDSHANEHYLVKDIGAKSGTAGVLAACFVVGVVAPFCEEFLFRGFIYGALRNWRGPVVAALLTGVLFGAVHVGSAPGVDLVPLGVFGVMLCAIRQYTGSLYPGVALHSLNNSVALVSTAGWGVSAFFGVLLGSFALLALAVFVGQRSLRLRLV
jgi:uncharacterized protein